MTTSQGTQGRFVLGWQLPKGKQGPRLSRRVRDLIEDPQAMGNYMTYRDAITILGLDPGTIYREGRIDLDLSEWSDLGWMAAHMGPPPAAVEAMRAATAPENIGPYSPDLIGPLRELVAVKKFGRARGPEFEVIGTEGAQAGVSFTVQTVVDPGDEVIVTDPGYFHFIPAVRLAGGVPVRIPLGPENGYRMQPEDLRRYLTERTKLIVICDPLNPFGVVQTREELIQIAAIAREAGAFVLDDITHNSHRIDPEAEHVPLSALYEETDTRHVITTFGMSHGYGMAAARIGFLAGDPTLMRACLAAKIALVRLNTNLIAQYGALAALEQGDDYLRAGEVAARANLEHISETVRLTPGFRIPVEPQYGFSMVIDVSGAGVSAQELCVALFKRRVAVYPGDGLGDVGATEFIRVNFSQPEIGAFERFRAALPGSIAEAKSGVYREAVIAFFEATDTDRGRMIVDKLKALG
ncbi:MAG: pyridoxal phosphate-dependent aminotransferase [Dehalococcoidia bacterium]